MQQNEIDDRSTSKLPVDGGSSTKPPDSVSSSGEKQRLDGLDGLRAVAVLLVLIAHFAHSQGTSSALDRVIDRGSFGVEIFFVLSGFLITYLLVREERQCGRIYLNLFYARRAIRILPPLLFYLAVLYGATLLKLVTIPGIDFIAGVFFFRNYVGTAPETGHLWTLAIEEQFYLAWPFFLCIVTGARARIAICLCVIIASPIWANFAYSLAGGAANVNSQRTDLRLQPILLGSLLALLQTSSTGVRYLKYRWATSPWFILAAILLLIVSEFTDLFTIPRIRLFRTTIACLSVAAIILYVTNARKSMLTQILEIPFIAWVGRLSYSLYLWQQPFAPNLPGIAPAYFREFPTNISLACACAIFSYYIIEKPLLKYRHRFRAPEISKTPPSPMIHREEVATLT